MLNIFKGEENLVNNFNQGLDLSLYQRGVNVPWGSEEIEKYHFRLLFMLISFWNFKVTDTFKRQY